MQAIPGSKPKKLIKRINLSNPTLLSNSITPLFNPDTNLATTERLKAHNLVQQFNSTSKKHQRTKSQINLKFDSLDAAQNEFIQRHNRSNSIRFVDRVNPQKFQQMIERKLNNSGYQATLQSCSHSYATKFNFVHSDSIRAKQNIGYNIISGLDTLKH